MCIRDRTNYSADKKVVMTALWPLLAATNPSFRENLKRATMGYSGDDITNVCRDAAMNGMRRKIVGKRPEEIRAMSKEEVAAPITMEDMNEALKRIQPSVAREDVERHLEWLAEFGST